MEDDLNNSNTSLKLKTEAMECNILSSKLQFCYTCSNIEIDHKKEEYEGAPPTTTITLGTAQNLLNGGILSNDFKIKLERSDDNDSCSDKELLERNNASRIEIMSNEKYCEKNYSMSIFLNTTIHGRERFTCKICFRRFKMIIGEKIQGICDKVHTCKTCNKRFTTKLNLSRHLKTHDKKTYKCEICNKCFATKRYLPEHAKTHTGERNHKCQLCDKQFMTKLNLSRHVKTHDGEKNYKCDICDKRFAAKLNLSRHVTTHTGERNYKCEICEKRFATKWDLSQHVKTHTREKNYECEVCDKRFTRKQHVLQHVVTHTRERNFKCKVCNNSFTRKQYLLLHVETHTGERNKCEICKKCFATKQNLREHVKTHTGERNYKCEICDKCFNRKHHLSRHVKTHGGNGNFKCEVYDMRCKKGKVSLEHMKIHAEGSHEEKFLQNFPCEEILFKPFIKEESDMFLKQDKLETNIDITERKPSMTANEICIVTAIKKEEEDDAESTNISNFRQTIDSEIIIKEEYKMDTSCFQI